MKMEWQNSETHIYDKRKTERCEIMDAQNGNKKKKQKITGIKQRFIQ